MRRPSALGLQQSSFISSSAASGPGSSEALNQQRGSLAASMHVAGELGPATAIKSPREHGEGSWLCGGGNGDVDLKQSFLAQDGKR